MKINAETKTRRAVSHGLSLLFYRVYIYIYIHEYILFYISIIRIYSRTRTKRALAEPDGIIQSHSLFHSLIRLYGPATVSRFVWACHRPRFVHPSSRVRDEGTEYIYIINGKKINNNRKNVSDYGYYRTVIVVIIIITMHTTKVRNAHELCPPRGILIGRNDLSIANSGTV